MRKKFKMLLLIVGALTLFSACSSTQSDIRGEGNQRALAMAASKTLKKPIIYEKKWKTTGKVAMMDTFTDGKVEGEFKRYYINGNLIMRGYFKDGVVDGIWEDYYPNGNLIMSGYMRGHKKIGKWKYYDENGKLLGEVPYDQIPKEIIDINQTNLANFWKDIKDGK